MIITADIFKGDLHIPQITQPDVLAKVNRFIEEYEPEYLRKAMAYTLSTAFVAGLAAAPPIADKWIKLRDGDNYIDAITFNNERYTGIKIAIGCYVYYKYLGSQAENVTGTAVSVPKGENSVTVSPIRKQTAVWNRMVSLNWQLWQYVYATQNTLGLTFADFRYYNNKGWWIYNKDGYELGHKVNVLNL